MYEKRKSDEVAASSDFLSSDNYCLWYIQQCKLRLPPFEQHGVSPCSCRKRYTPGRCSCRPPPAFGSACFWVSSHSPKGGTDRHCRQAWQGAGCLFRTAGTSHRTSAGLSVGVRPPAASSWYVPNTFRPAKVYDPSPRMGDAFPSASPQRISCSVPPSQMVADGRLPPAPPFPSDS